MTGTSHLIGLLLGTEEDWPTAFKEILRRLGPVTGPDGTVRSQHPAHEHDRFIAHLRGLLGLWVSDESARLRTA